MSKVIVLESRSNGNQAITLKAEPTRESAPVRRRQRQLTSFPLGEMIIGEP